MIKCESGYADLCARCAAMAALQHTLGPGGLCARSVHHLRSWQVGHVCGVHQHNLCYSVLLLAVSNEVHITCLCEHAVALSKDVGRSRQWSRFGVVW